MILGWLRKQQADRKELDELRAFADQTEGLLESLDLMWDLQELAEQEEIAIGPDAFFKAKYVEMDWGGGNRRFHVPIFQKQDFLMPEPGVELFTEYSHVHQAEIFSYRFMISDQELILRRTPGQMRELADRMQHRVHHTISDALVKRAGVTA